MLHWLADMGPENRHEGWRIEASGTFHHDRDDMCDPTTNTYVIRAAEPLFMFGFDVNLHDPSKTIEAHIEDYLRDHFAPGRCGCSHDCCGHRFGYAEATHVRGAIYLVEVHTSRNY